MKTSVTVGVDILQPLELFRFLGKRLSACKELNLVTQSLISAFGSDISIINDGLLGRRFISLDRLGTVADTLLALAHLLALFLIGVIIDRLLLIVDIDIGLRLNALAVVVGGLIALEGVVNRLGKLFCPLSEAR